MITKQQWQDALLENHFTKEPPPLPQVFSDVRRVKGGYKVFSKGKWTFYASSCLSEAEVSDLEEWLDDPVPVKRAA